MHLPPHHYRASYYSTVSHRISRLVKVGMVRHVYVRIQEYIHIPTLCGMRDFRHSEVTPKKHEDRDEINPRRRISPTDNDFGNRESGVEAVLRDVGPRREFGAQGAVREHAPENNYSACVSTSIAYQAMRKTEHRLRREGHTGYYRWECSHSGIKHRVRILQPTRPVLQPRFPMSPIRPCVRSRNAKVKC